MINVKHNDVNYNSPDNNNGGDLKTRSYDMDGLMAAIVIRSETIYTTSPQNKRIIIKEQTLWEICGDVIIYEKNNALY